MCSYYKSAIFYFKLVPILLIQLITLIMEIVRLLINQSQLNSSTYFNSTNPASSLNYPIPHTYTTSSCPGTSFIVTLMLQMHVVRRHLL
jgi:hypothetical protein